MGDSRSIDILHFINDHISALSHKYPEQTEFLNAVKEQLPTLIPFLKQNPDYLKCVPFLTEPEFLYTFKVCWEDDNGCLRLNTGYRCHFCNALGPYKGGLRFAPSVTPSVIKFLAFEQVFKNALTGLPMGGGKGGSDFDPKGKSEAEIRRFCISFAQQLVKIGICLPEGRVDTPAGDIGVSGKEVGYIFGEMKRATNSVPFASITGKPLELGGSLGRPEATGYGLIYILERALKDKEESLKGKRCLVTGSGNVSIFCAEKLIHLGAVVLTLSDSAGAIKKLNGGFTQEELDIVKVGKFSKKERLHQILGVLNEKEEKFRYYAGKMYTGVWDIESSEADCYLPCATQGEVDLAGAKTLVEIGVKYVAEGANMPSTNEAIEYFLKNMKIFIPAKASNAGGVAVSGLEMAQNGARTSWSKDKVDQKLQKIMSNIYENISKTAADLGDEGNLVLGANCASFKKVSDALMAEGRIF